MSRSEFGALEATIDAMILGMPRTVHLGQVLDEDCPPAVLCHPDVSYGCGYIAGMADAWDMTRVGLLHEIDVIPEEVFGEAAEPEAIPMPTDADFRPGDDAGGR